METALITLTCFVIGFFLGAYNPKPKGYKPLGPPPKTPGIMTTHQIKENPPEPKSCLNE